MKKLTEESREASERSFFSQKSMIFDLAILLKEYFVGGLDNIAKGSVMEYFAQRSLTCKNQEREDRFEVDRVATARR